MRRTIGAGMSRRLFLASAGTLCAAPLLRASAAAETAVLANEGNALVPIVVAPYAADRTRQAAQNLCDYLSRMAGATFRIEAGDGASGIVVGAAAEFPDMPLAASLDTNEPTRREDYRLSSHRGGLRLIGATELAVQHAVWDLLYRLGYRQFFPGKRWEVVPSIPNLAITVDTAERPDWYARRIWPGFGLWGYNNKPYRDWCAKNRATAGIDLSTTHEYEFILRAEKAQFEAHPEYLGLVGGERKSTKFCISNPGLRHLVVGYALRRFEKEPELDSISMDPSDGGGWCECEDCAALGSISDRALTLANAVAAAVTEKYPGKLVGMFAYNQHSPPPNIEAHPQVVISVSTAFIKDGFTFDEVFAGWLAKCRRLGVREYLSVSPWDRDRPGLSRACSLGYLAHTIPDFHRRGARFYSAEAGDNWGPNGLGYFLAARMLWDRTESERIEALVDDFLERAFGPAKEPMRAFYSELEGAEPISQPAERAERWREQAERRAASEAEMPARLGRMFRALDQAGAMAEEADVQARIGDLVLYARYVDLFQRYRDARGDARQAAFEALIRHAYRMRRTMLVHVKILYKSLPRRDSAVSVPPEAAWDVPDRRNSWKSSEPFAPEEIVVFLREGAERYPAL